MTVLTIPARRLLARTHLRAGGAALAVYVTAVVAANWLTAHYGLVPVGFGQTATAGTFAVGVAILVRDVLQDAWGRSAVLAATAVGAVASAALATPQLAVASGVTFLVAETLELAVYTPLRRRTTFGTRRWSVAVTCANVTGAALDTLLFLRLAGFPVSGHAVAGQLLGKLWVSAAVIVVVTAVRRLRTRTA